MTTETERMSFLGIPVIGEINKNDERTPQRPLAELEPLIRNVIEDPEIYAFGWEQYTPYFNDGEPCIFGVGYPWFLTVTDVVKLLEEAGKPTQKAEPVDQAREVLRRAGINPDEVLRPTEPQPSLEPAAPVTVDRNQLPEFDDLPEFNEDDYRVSYGEHPTLGKATYTWVIAPDGGRHYIEVPGSYRGSHAVRYNAASELSRAFDSGAFDDVLLTAFGDHCRVVVQRSGIHVDEFSHD